MNALLDQIARLLETKSGNRQWTKIREIDAEGKPRERIQIFTGVVIGRKGSSISETFTVQASKPKDSRKC